MKNSFLKNRGEVQTASILFSPKVKRVELTIECLKFTESICIQRFFRGENPFPLEDDKDSQ